MIEIRRALPGDIERLAQIEALSFPPEEKASLERMKARFAVFPEYFVVALSEGEVVGLIDGMVTNAPVIADEMYEKAELHDPKGAWQSVFGLAVDPAHRKRGVGGLLLNTLIEIAREEGRNGVILTCKEALKPWYESFGFVSGGVSQSVHGGAVWYDMTLAFGDAQ